MLSTRIIPVLLLHNQGLVKTVKFKNPSYIGDPINAIKIFNEKEVDELVFFDIDASKKGVEPNYDLISDFASECFMPVCYGGGIKNISQIKKIFSLGIEKVSLNFIEMIKTDVVKEAISVFGAQSIVVTIDLKKTLFGRYRLYNYRLGKLEKDNIEDIIEKVNQIGVGEIIVNNVDREGTQSGYDIALMDKITSLTSIPVVAYGGASKLEDFKELKEKTNISGMAAGSFFVFQGKHNAVLISYPKYETLKKLFNKD